MKTRQHWVKDDILDNLFVWTWRHLWVSSQLTEIV